MAADATEEYLFVKNTGRIQQHREQTRKLRVRRMGEYNLNDLLKRRRHICGAVQSVHVQRLLPRLRDRDVLPEQQVLQS